MDGIDNCVLIQNCTMTDLQRMIERAVDSRMAAFYEKIKSKQEVLVKRKEAAVMLAVSLPTLDNYGKFGILHPKRLGGRVFYTQSEIEKYKQNNGKRKFQ